MAVAIRSMGFVNVKIYNGGLKEWRKADKTIRVLDSLPEYSAPVVEKEVLLNLVEDAGKSNCLNETGQPLFTLLDIRIELSIDGAKGTPVIKTECDTITGLLDSLMDEEFRSRIPSDTPVYIISETGNRDQFAARYMFKFGYTNLYSVRFGMRGWLKADYPTIMNNDQWEK